MNRKIKITNTTKESTNHLQRVPLFLEDYAETHLFTYAENVYIDGRKALTEGKFHDMFMAGDGHELEDFTDENGNRHIAHARSIFSSSMLAYATYRRPQNIELHSIRQKKHPFTCVYAKIVVNLQPNWESTN